MSRGYPSLQKQAARHQAYFNWIKSRSPNHKRTFLEGTHIVVAGNGGDQAWLVQAGVFPQYILASDRVRDRRMAAKSLGALVPPDHIGNDIVKTVEWAIHNEDISPVSTINIDVCASVKTVAPLVKAVLDLVDLNKVFVFAHYCNGRGDNESSFHSNEERIQYLKEIVGKRARKMFRRYNYQPWSMSASRNTTSMTMVGW